MVVGQTACDERGHRVRACGEAEGGAPTSRAFRAVEERQRALRKWGVVLAELSWYGALGPGKKDIALMAAETREPKATATLMNRACA